MSKLNTEIDYCESELKRLQALEPTREIASAIVMFEKRLSVLYDTPPSDRAFRRMMAKQHRIEEIETKPPVKR